MHLQIINPIEYPNWDELLLTNDQSTFFHTSAWARVLRESYKYKSLYFTSIDNGKISALIPIMEVKSFITGKRGVSLPFTDYCQPIFSDKTDSQKIIDELIDYGKKAGWRHIEWRGGESCLEGAKPYLVFFSDSSMSLVSETNGRDKERTISSRTQTGNGQQITVNDTSQSPVSSFKFPVSTKPYVPKPPLL